MAWFQQINNCMSAQREKTSSTKARPITTVKADKSPRSDGQQARQRLTETALRMFAERGFAKTSIRELAAAAEVNVSAISYYFGDKAGLYRAVFHDERFNPNIDPVFLLHQDTTLEQGISVLIKTYIEAFKHGELMQYCITLHCREMLEPTGLWQEEIDQMIKPSHDALCQFLVRHLGLAQVDQDIHRLCFALWGLAVSPTVTIDVIMAVQAELIDSDKAIDLYIERTIQFALAMVESERQRRIHHTSF